MQRVLEQFAFLRSWLGRGVVLVLMGLLFVTIPWDQARICMARFAQRVIALGVTRSQAYTWINRVSGALMVVCGCLQIVIACFIIKVRTRTRAGGI